MPQLKEHYRIFLILERELWLQENSQFVATKSPAVANFELYADLPAQFPPRPQKYASLILSDDWFMKKSTDKELSSKAMASITSCWNSVQGEIHLYASTIAVIVSNRRDQIRLCFRSTQGQAKRDSLPVCQQRQQFQGQSASPSGVMTARSDVSASMPLLPFQAHHQARRANLSDMNSNRIAMYWELNRLSSFVAATWGFDLREEPSAIESGHAYCQPVGQLNNFNSGEEPDIKDFLEQQWDGIRAWADEFVNMAHEDVVEQYDEIDQNSTYVA
ncbi:hypothetical protein ACHAWO_013048 [Cyclotella atomus]|uniref:Uncharacterized protein n=1 Tax=Cyclotella atomus TaxID=382360 RepID=A0ABD3NQZ1_9STRA